MITETALALLARERQVFARYEQALAAQIAAETVVGPVRSSRGWRRTRSWE